MISKIVLCCDFLMTRAATQRHHLRWFSTLVGRALRESILVEASTFVSDTDETSFQRSVFFDLSGIALDEVTTHMHFEPDAISGQSIELIQHTFRETLVIGYELSEETRAVLSKADIPFIDVWLHPIRFLDDNLFAFLSSSDQINSRISQFHIDERIFYLYADKLKIQSYMGWNKYRDKLNSELIPNSSLFVGQTLTDKAVCRNGKMLNVLDFRDEFEDFTNCYEHVYFSRHPMLRGDDQDQLDFIKSFRNVSLIEVPGYQLLTTDAITHISAISSSLVYEAQFFGKASEYLFKPVISIANREKSGYFSTYSKLHSPAFWRSLLQDVAPVSETIVDYDFLKPQSNYRDMLALFYNNHVFEKEQYTFAALNRIAPSDVKTPKAVATKKPKHSKDDSGLQLNEPSLARLKGMIDHHDIVSFDLFDTLVERDLWVPGDVVKIVSQVAEARYGLPASDVMRARRDAKKHSTKNETPLSERYEIVSRLLGVSPEIGDNLHRIELDVERAVLRPKVAGKLLLDYARSTGKRTIIVSDTYFDRKFIEDLLLDFDLTVDAVFLSSEHDETKEKGGLYEVVAAHESANILHIGDNIVADHKNATQKGIDSAWLISGHEQLRRCAPTFVQIDTKYAGVRNGVVQRALTNYPAVTTASGYTRGQAHLLGHNVVGDLMLSFAAWIVDKAEKDGVRTLYFLARDGEVVKKAVDSLLAATEKTSISTKFLLASRRCLRVIALEEASDVRRESEAVIAEIGADRSRATLEKYLSVRFGLGTETLQAMGVEALNETLASLPQTEGLERLSHFLNSPEFIDAVLSNAQQERSLYLEYLDQEGLTNTSSPIGLVDIGHNGSLQASLAAIRKLMQTRGYYFVTYDGVDSNLARLNGDHTALGYFKDRISPADRSEAYVRYALLVEALFLNDHGTFVRMNKTDGVLAPEFLAGETERRLRFNRDIHAGVVEYCQAVLSTIKNAYGTIDLPGLWESQNVCRRLFSMFSAPSWRDADVFSGIFLENFFAGRNIRYLVPPRNKLSTPSCLWKEGTAELSAHYAPRKTVSKATPPSRRKETQAEDLTLWFRIEQKLVSKVISKSRRKLDKYHRDPSLFFSDSKIPLLRIYGSVRQRVVGATQSS